MKSVYSRPLVFAAVLTAWAAAVPAAVITFNPAVNISATTDVNRAGASSYAYCWSPGNRTVNGVTFTGTNASGTVGGNLTLGNLSAVNSTAYTVTNAPFGNLSAVYKSALTGAVYNSLANSTGTVTLLNLTVGRPYLVQAWVSDPRSGGTAGRTQTVFGAGGNVQLMKFNSTAAAGGVGQYITGLFTADDTNQSFTVASAGTNSLSGGNIPQLNAIQLRDLNGLAPYWQGAVNGNLDNATANFTGGQTLPQILSVYPSVYFADTDGLGGGVGATNITVQAGGVVIPSLIFGNTGLVYTLDSVDAAGLSGATAVALQGAGLVIFSGTNSYTGATTIGAGNRLEIGPNGVLGATAIANAGTFLYGGAGQTLGAVLGGAGSFRVSSAGTLNLTGAGTNTGPISIEAGTLQIGGAGTLGNGAFPGNITNNGALIFASSSNLTCSGVLSGTGTLTVAGSGILTLSAASVTYTGLVYVNGGQLTLSGGTGGGGTNKIASPWIYVNPGATLYLGTGAQLNYGAGTPSIWLNGGTLGMSDGQYNYVKTIVLTNGATWALGTGALINNLVGANFSLKNVTSLASTNTCTITTRGGAIAATAGIIFDVERGTAATDLSVAASLADYSGSFGSLTKTGSGILALGWTNAYSGPTAVNVGTLLVNGALISNSVVTVAAGATLGGRGIIRGPVTNSGTVAPGSGAVGILTLSNVFAQTSGGTLAIELGGVLPSVGYDQLRIAGAANLDGTVTVAAVNGFAPEGYTFTILQAGSVSGTFAATNLPALSGNYAWTVQYLATSVVISAVSTGSNSLVWSPTVSADWDTATINWTNPALAAAVAYAQGDTVLFDDSGAFSNQVNLTTALAPLAITVSASSNYLLGGAGRISGATALTKDGVGTLTLTSTNDYQGGTTISNGVLQLGNGGVCGAVGSGPVANGGALVFNNGDTSTAANAIGGSGGVAKTGAGTVILSGTNTYAGGTAANGGVLQFNATAAFPGVASVATGGVVLLNVGNATWTNNVSGAGLLRVNATSAAAGNTYLRGDYTGFTGTLEVLAASGAGKVTLDNAAFVALPPAGALIQVGAASTLLFARTNLASAVDLMGAGNTENIGALRVESASVVSGPVTLRGNSSVGANTSQTGTIASSVGQSGGSYSLTKQGGGTIILATTNGFTGGVSPAGGLLVLAGGDNTLKTNNVLSFTGSAALSLGASAQTLGGVSVGNNFTGSVQGPGSLTVRGADVFIGAITADNQTSTLILSNLAQFVFNDAAHKFEVGGQGAGNTIENGVVHLADTNLIIASQIRLAPYATDGNSGAAAGKYTTGSIYLGSSNTFQTALFQIGAQNNDAFVRFQGGMTNPTLVLRGLAGDTNRLANVYVGYRLSAWYGDGIGLLDLTTGVSGTSVLDARIGTMDIGLMTSRNDNGKSMNGDFLMGGGLLDATAINVGNRQVGLGTDTANMTVNGGTVLVQTLTIGQVSSAGTTISTLNLNTGSLLRAQTIAAGAGTATRNFNWNDGTIQTYDAATDLAINGLSLNLAGAGAHVFDAGAGRRITVSSTLTNSGGLAKIGAGTLVLHGVSTRSGTLAVSNGTLLVNGSAGPGLVEVAAGTTLGGTGVVGGTVICSGVVAPGTTGAGRLTLSDFNPTAAGAVNIEIGGAAVGTQYDNLVVTNVAFLDGTLNVSFVNGYIPAGGDSFTLVQGMVLGGAFVSNNLPALAGLGFNLTQTATSVVLDVTGTLASVVWMPQTNAAWDVTSSNWFDGVATTGLYLQGSAVRFDDNGAYSNNVSLDLPLTPARVTVDSSSNYTFGGSGYLTGGMYLTKTGTATLVVTATNNFSGITTIAQGALQLGAGGACGTLGTGAVIDQGQLVFDHSDNSALPGAISGPGSLTKSGPGTMSLTGGITITGPTTVSNGTLRIDQATAFRYAPVGIRNAGTLEINAVGGIDSWVYSFNSNLAGNVFSGTGTIVKTGAGWFQFDYGGAGSFAGRVIISNGVFGSAMDRGVWTNFRGDVTCVSNALGMGVLDLRSDPMTIDELWGDGEVWNSWNSQAQTLTVGAADGSSTFGGRIRGAGGGGQNNPDGNLIAVSKVGSGTLTLAGRNTYAGSTTIDGGTLVVTDTGKLYHGAYMASAVVTIRSNSVLDLATWAYSETGSESLGGLRANTGAIVIDGGTIRVRKNSAYYRGLVIGAAGATLEAAAGASWTLDFADTAPITNALGGPLLLTGAGTGTVHKVIPGSGRLVKSGGGAWVLMATNTYNGPTVISNGTLLVNGVIGPGAVTLDVGATLGGAGVVKGFVSQNGILSPGTGIGILTVSNQVNCGATAVTRFELGGTNSYDQLVVSDLHTLNGTLEVVTTNGYVPASGDRFNLITNTALGGLLFGPFPSTSLPTLPSGMGWEVQYSASDAVSLVVTGSVYSPTPYEAWAAQIPNPADRGDQNDADNDGYANLLEYSQGSDPTNNANNAKLNLVRTNGMEVIVFNRVNTATDIVYEVQASYAPTNNAEWQGLATNSVGSWGSSTNVNDDNTATIHRVWVSDLILGTNRSLRLKVTRP